MGREGWFEETMSFYRQHLKGLRPPVEHPPFAIQDHRGAWRAQDTWPVAQGGGVAALGSGSYVDDGAETVVTAENTFTKWSDPVARDTRLTGTPRMASTTEGRGNVMVQLYDVAPDGTAVNFDEQVAVLNQGTTGLELTSVDRTLESGHRLAVVDDPVDDVATPGDRAPYLDTYLQLSTTHLVAGHPTFTLPRAGR